MKPEIPEETLACAGKPSLCILPEIHAFCIQNHVFPEDFPCDPPAFLSVSDVAQRRYDLGDSFFIEFRPDRNMHRLVEIRPLHRNDDMEEPSIFSRGRQAPENPHKIMVPLQTGFHGSSINEFQKPLPIRRITVPLSPGIDDRSDALPLCTHFHRLIRQRGFYALHRVMFQVKDSDVTAHVIQIAHGRHRRLLKVLNIDFHILDMDRIKIMVLLYRLHGSRELHVVIAGRIGRRLRAFLFPELLIGILPVENMDRVAGRVHFMFPAFQIPHIVLC